ncbi:DUF559 domain-containing protein [Arthrobacter horti]|uniref:DUF559 domain-containing protein n=1 Tax=Arthrobacter horti TaxID=3068273 RepID=UPI00273E34BE|nr:DUF559 domain-containing protein [Arthrobacter sp. YJM1]
MPEPLGTAPFTLTKAWELGVHHERLRRKDLVMPTRGVREPVTGEMDRISRFRPLLEVTHGIASHTSACHLLGLPVPGFLSDSTHISVPKGRDAPHRPGIQGHALTLFPGEVISLDGMWVTSPARTFLDMAALLPEIHLVALGDAIASLGRRPWSRQDVPAVPPDELRKYLDWKRGTPGIRKARLAAQLVRSGVDSPPESFLRLAFIDAHLPEFTPDCPVIDGFGTIRHHVDLGNEHHRIAVEHDGEHHRTREQQRIDARRNALMQELGWRQVIIVADDLKNDCASAVSKVRRMLRSAA